MLEDWNTGMMEYRRTGVMKMETLGGVLERGREGKNL
jgi:hypothetical protein